MKRVFLLMVVSALLVTLGFAQTPAAGEQHGPGQRKRLPGWIGWQLHGCGRRHCVRFSRSPPAVLISSRMSAMT